MLLRTPFIHFASLFCIGCFTTFSVHLQGQVITTLAGSGVAGYTGNGAAAISCTLNNPWGVAVDAADNVYISDAGNTCVRLVNAAGEITTFAGTDSMGYSGDGGQATAATLNDPMGICTSGTNVFIADAGNNCVRLVNSSGIITTIAGNGSAGFSGDDTSQATAALLNGPVAIATDGSGNIYVADRNNNRVRKINTSGIISTVAGNGTLGFSGDGGAATAAALDLPTGIAIDGSGNLYIADEYNNRIRRVSVSGTITTFAGTGLAGFSGDGGSATAAKLYYPAGIALDNHGNLLVADAFNLCIRKISGGIVTTVAGDGIAGFSGDGGEATAAELNYPTDIAVAAGGDVYIADQGNNRIRTLNVVTTGIEQTTATHDGATIFPNPGRGSVNLYVASALDENAAVSVYNITGNSVLTAKVPTNKRVLFATNVPNGVYVVQIKASTFSQTLRLIVAQ